MLKDWISGLTRLPAPGEKEARGTDLFCCGLLLIMVIALFGRTLTGHSVLMLRDLFFDFYPRQMFMREQLLEGVFPFWNPYTGCGHPLVAETEAGLFYPPNYIFYLIPAQFSIPVSEALHIFLGAVGVYALCRFWRLIPLAGLFAATAFAFNTIALCKAEYPPEVHSSAWVPIVLYFFLRWFRNGTPRDLLFTTGALALQFLAGWPEASLFTAGMLACLAAYESLCRWRRGESSRQLSTPWLALAAAGAFSVALSMIQFLPTVEAVLGSTRGTDGAGLAEGSADPWSLFGLFYPSIYGVQGHVGRYWAPTMAEYWMGPLYMGIVPVLVLIATALVRRAGASQPREAKQMPVAFLLILLAASTLYAMGQNTPFYGALGMLLPALDFFDWPVKSLMITALAFSLLVGWGLHELATRPGALTRRASHVFVACCWGAAMVTLVLLFNDGQLGQWLLRRVFNMASVAPAFAHRIPWGEMRQDAVVMILLLVAGPVLVIAFHRYPQRAGRIGLVLVSVLYVDLYLQGQRILITGPADLLNRAGTTPQVQAGSAVNERVLEGTRELRFAAYGSEDTEVYRLARETSASSWAGVDRLNKPVPVDVFLQRNAMAVLGILLNADTPEPARQRIRRMLAVHRTVRIPGLEGYYRGSDIGRASVTEYDDALPRVYMTGRPLIARDQEAVWETLRARPFEPLESAVVTQEIADTYGLAGLAEGRIGHRIDQLDVEANTAVMRVVNDQAGLLVMSDIYYPGWRARVDGTPQPIFEVNGMARGILLSPGAHEITMAFQPRSFRIGAVITGIALLCYVVMLFRSLRSRRSATA